MRAFLVLALLLAATARAEEVADEADVLRVQLAESRARAAAAVAEIAQRELAAARQVEQDATAAFRSKYKLADGDGIDEKRVIHRKPAAAPPPAKAAKK